MPVARLKAENLTPGQFVFTADPHGRPRTAEGWLGRQPAPRQQAAQDRVAGGLAGYHAGHLIPARFGGPGDERNLVPMPDVINVSYVKAVENAISRYLSQGTLYLHVSVEYRVPGPLPALVTHTLFRRSAGGRVEPIPGGRVITNVAAAPSSPMGSARDPYTGKALPPKEFLDPKSNRGLGPHGAH